VRPLLVRGVPARAAADDDVLAALGQQDELVGVLAADGAAIGLDGQGRQAAA
jgi:hypothetical protein